MRCGSLEAPQSRAERVCGLTFDWEAERGRVLLRAKRGNIRKWKKKRGQRALEGMRHEAGETNRIRGINQERGKKAVGSMQDAKREINEPGEN